MTVLDSCLFDMGRSNEAVHLGRALELYEELGDQRYVAIVLSDRGNISFVESDWVQAAADWERAVEAANAVGDLSMVVYRAI